MREGKKTAKEKILNIDEYEVKINYEVVDNPDALSAIRCLLEKQIIMLGKAPKFDAIKRKCDNDDRKCTLKTE